MIESLNSFFLDWLIRVTGTKWDEKGEETGASRSSQEEEIIIIMLIHPERVVQRGCGDAIKM